MELTVDPLLLQIQKGPVQKKNASRLNTPGGFLGTSHCGENLDSEFAGDFDLFKNALGSSRRSWRVAGFPSMMPWVVKVLGPE